MWRKVLGFSFTTTVPVTYTYNYRYTWTPSEGITTDITANHDQIFIIKIWVPKLGTETWGVYWQWIIPEHFCLFHKSPSLSQVFISEEHRWSLIFFFFIKMNGQSVTTMKNNLNLRCITALGSVFWFQDKQKQIFLRWKVSPTFSANSTLKWVYKRILVKYILWLWRKVSKVKKKKN